MRISNDPANDVIDHTPSWFYGVDGHQVVFFTWTYGCLLIPTMRVTLYAAVVGVIGTLIFSAHFWKYQSDGSRAFCSELLHKFSVVGALIPR